MTANATINVATAKNALAVPLAALHTNAAATSPWGSVSGSAATGAIAAGSNARLVVDRNGKPVPIDVYVRLTNGTQAAVEPANGAALAAGDKVVIGTKFDAPQRQRAELALAGRRQPDGRDARDSLMTPVVSVAELRKEYAMGGDRVYALRGVDLTVAARRVRRRDGPVGFGQIDLHARRRSARHADRRERTASKAPTSRTSLPTSAPTSADAASASSFRRTICSPRTTALENVELPMVYAGVPEDGAPAHRAREARDWSASRISRSIIPIRCRADSSSASRSRARWSTIPA